VGLLERRLHGLLALSHRGVVLGGAVALIRPRLIDCYDVPLTQEAADFAIPFLDEDIPLHLDPFLLWRSAGHQDQTLHTGLINSFNHLVVLARSDQNKAAELLHRASECEEAGLGHSATRKGHRISVDEAGAILDAICRVPHVRDSGFVHFEEIQLYSGQIRRDRVSDIACSFLKSFLIDYTIDRCRAHAIPMEEVGVPEVYDYRSHAFVSERVTLPVNPETHAPVLLVPKRWLRYEPWINSDDYFAFASKTARDGISKERVPALVYDRHYHETVASYIREKERTQADCRNDPLFLQIPISSVKRKLKVIKALPTGKDENADKKYEDAVTQLLASMLYPHLDFAQAQSRTDSNVLIRDLIFYNGRSTDFLADIFEKYGSRQLVFELKNVKVVERDHVNQLNRYLAQHFGSFGVLVTRNRLPKAIFKSTIDLWSGQRKCIIALTDEDLDLMVNVFESKQRSPVEVLKKKYIEFTRACPS
jgi:hypothetical protein